MSIIYDALKKVESKLNSDSNIAKPKTEKKSKHNTKKYLLFIVIACLGFVIASISFNLLMPSHKGLSKKDIKNSLLQTDPIQGIMAPAENIADTANNPPPLAPRESPESSQSQKQTQSSLLVLNGVFFSQNQGYALINNRIVKEGDTIDGAIVERISLDGVDLNSAGLVIKLYTSSQ